MRRSADGEKVGEQRRHQRLILGAEAEQDAAGLGDLKGAVDLADAVAQAELVNLDYAVCAALEGGGGVRIVAPP